MAENSSAPEPQITKRFLEDYFFERISGNPLRISEIKYWINFGMGLEQLNILFCDKAKAGISSEKNNLGFQYDTGRISKINSDYLNSIMGFLCSRPKKLLKKALEYLE